MRYLYWLICTLLLLAAGCSSGRPHDERLLEISDKVSDSPEVMLVRLDSMDVASLGEADRYFHALMRIKAQDKAFVRHTSDSVILRVIGYYSRHPKSGLYPEALYYGGRVYSDLGDAPTALRYFQDALDALPEGKDDEFRATILSQTGRLLNALRLYTEGASYVKQAVKLQTMGADSVKLMQNTQLLGAIYMHSEDYDLADSCFMVAYRIAKSISHPDTLAQRMYLAVMELYKDDISAALKNIRKVLKEMPVRWEDMIYSYASQIYLKAGISDSAYLYAIKLIKDENIDYQRIGYDVVLNPSLMPYSSSDSIRSYIKAYRAVIDAYLSRHDAQQATLQTSLYNYQIHERERKIAEKVKRIYIYVAGLALIVVLALCIVLLFLRNRRIKLQLDYHNALDNIDRLERSLLSTEEKLKKYEKTVEVQQSEKSEVERKIRQAGEKVEIQDEKNEASQVVENAAEDSSVREQLKERLLALQRAGKARKSKPEDILEESVLARLHEHIDAVKGIDTNDDIWMDVEGAVLRVSPEFKSRLSLLIGEKMKQDVYHMALLVRCGFGTTDTGRLLGRTKGAVSSRRSYVCERIFGQKYGVKVMDDIINLL